MIEALGENNYPFIVDAASYRLGNHQSCIGIIAVTDEMISVRKAGLRIRRNIVAIDDSSSLIRNP